MLACEAKRLSTTWSHPFGPYLFPPDRIQHIPDALSGAHSHTVHWQTSHTPEVASTWEHLRQPAALHTCSGRAVAGQLL